ncbi:MAG: citramalate synthase [Propionibacteriaceae bacterium]|jgi:2-isopropylmalate synthase|nr:citramalate synthase [Propionibacteriaceae bacterium]
MGVALPEPFYLFDTTLRDGAQQEGIQLSVADKLRIAKLLDELGMHFIEGGWPGANPADTEFFATAARELTLRHAQLVAFGATRKAGGEAASDQLVRALVDAGTQWVCIVAKSHAGHVREALKTSLDENLAMVADTVTYLRAQGKQVIVDAEHFFDGFLLDSEYALQVIRTAAAAGAANVTLCDTNGGMLPYQVNEIVKAALTSGVALGIHCHNDSGCAVANSLAAIDAGCVLVQGTMNGYGERTGNLDLTTAIANLQLKYGWPLLAAEQLANLTHTAAAIADIANQPYQPRQPYVGASAFAHKAGLHASALLVDEDLYQHIKPTLVGNGMRMLISDMAGRSNVQIKAAQLGLDLNDRQLASDVADLVKEREAAGYSYEAADASFELLVRQFLRERNVSPQVNPPFEVVSWRVFTEERAGLDLAASSEATVKLKVEEQIHNYVGEGNGPVNALGIALARALTPAFPQVKAYELTDYRVRVLDTDHGTDASVRVLIDTSNGSGARWTTVGVGTNVIEASWEALSDSYLYGLLKGF